MSSPFSAHQRAGDSRGLKAAMPGISMLDQTSTRIHIWSTISLPPSSLLPDSFGRIGPCASAAVGKPPKRRGGTGLVCDVGKVQEVRHGEPAAEGGAAAWLRLEGRVLAQVRGLVVLEQAE